MKKLLFVVVLMFVAFNAGCETGIFTDPDTGEQTKYHYLDPNTAEQYEDVAEGIVTTGTALLPLLPWLAPFVAAGGGILGTWKKLKPKLTASEKEKGDFARGGAALAIVLQEIKKNHPIMWEKIGPMLVNMQKGDTALQDAIKEFRRLLPRA